MVRCDWQKTEFIRFLPTEPSDSARIIGLTLIFFEFIRRLPTCFPSVLWNDILGYLVCDITIFRNEHRFLSADQR